MASVQNPLELPADAARIVTGFIADAIDHAHGVGPSRWGLTDYQPDIRLNVGFTEVLTTEEDHLRLICDGALVAAANVKGRASIALGQSRQDYYKSIPGSACLEIPFEPIDSLQATLDAARPALFEAMRVSSRRGPGSGVRAGHAPDLVREIGRFVRRTLPQPEYIARPSSSSSERDPAELFEGALRRITSNRFERNRPARAKCIAHYGAACQVCRFSFATTFGQLGDGFIHVHHVSPVSMASAEYVVDPVRDLRPVCPNCHAMLHVKDPPLPIEELRSVISKRMGDA